MTSSIDGLAARIERLHAGAGFQDVKILALQDFDQAERAERASSTTRTEKLRLVRMRLTVLTTVSIVRSLF